MLLKGSTPDGESGTSGTGHNGGTACPARRAQCDTPRERGMMRFMSTPSFGAAARILAERDPVIARLVAEAGLPRLSRPTETHFGTLVRAIVYQQLAGRAAAVPAFAEQTGQPCVGCHVGGFGPQLTPFGRAFKLGGYTLRTNSFNVPLSAMAVASYIRTQKGQPSPPASSFRDNDNFALDQVILFVHLQGRERGGE